MVAHNDPTFILPLWLQNMHSPPVQKGRDVSIIVYLKEIEQVK
jgi:hypothetical protein